MSGEWVQYKAGSGLVQVPGAGGNLGQESSKRRGEVFGVGTGQLSHNNPNYAAPVSSTISSTMATKEESPTSILDKDPLGYRQISYPKDINSMQNGHYIIFYVILFSIPWSVNILQDIFYKEPIKLNATLGKASGLLVLDYILLFISQLL